MKKLVIFVFSILFFLQISTTVLAQIGSLSGFDLAKTIGFIIGDPNIQQNHPDWLEIPNVIYYLVFPFIAIVTVLYGIFSEIRIFRSSTVKTILAIVIGGMSLPTGAMITTVYFMYTLGAWVAVITFGIVFIVGTILWGYTRLWGLKGSIQDAQSRIKAINAQLHVLDDQLTSGVINEDQYIARTGKLRAEKRRIFASLGAIETLGEGEK